MITIVIKAIDHHTKRLHMKALQVYLGFPGNCEEALNFYCTCFGGEIKTIRYLEEEPDHDFLKEGDVLHAEFEAENIYFMASDGLSEEEVLGGTVTLSLECTDSEEQDEIFKSLSEGGEVTMPLQDTFWGARFGMLTDRFGIRWMLTYSDDSGRRGE